METIIVGGGVCGLALAHALAPDHDVTVLESSPGPRGGGYMIDFFGPGFGAAERMGLIDELRIRGRQFTGVRYAAPDGTDTATIDVAALLEGVGGRYFSILRPEVESALLAALPESVRLRYGAPVTAVDTVGDDRAEVTLANGECRVADLVVACDGVRSVVRGFVAPGHEEILPMGYRVASYLFEDPELASELGDRMLMTDTVGRVGWAYSADPVRVGVMLAERVDRTATDHPAADVQRLRSRYAGLHPQIDRALAAAPDSFYDDLVAQSSAPRWHRGRVVLAGDAAHAVSLLAGQGTSLAIAGAEALANSLRDHGTDVEAALTAYERRWRPAVERVQRSGRRGAAFFIPASAVQLRMQQVARRALSLPGVGRLAARRFLAP